MNSDLDVEESIQKTVELVLTSKVLMQKVVDTIRETLQAEVAHITQVYEDKVNRLKEELITTKNKFELARDTD